MKTMKVTWDNDPNALMHIFIDSTNVRKLEEERAKNHCQKIMFASVSHEFRTPLNSFENSLDLISVCLNKMTMEWVNHESSNGLLERCNKNVARIGKYIKMGKVSAKLLMNLVEDILDLEKFDSNSFSLNIEDFHLKDLVEDIKYIFQMQCIERGIAFEVEVAEHDLLTKFSSDSGRIKQVLINLISNAIKFTPSGSITILMSSNNGPQTPTLNFSVIDTGIGIKKEDQPKLFQMFTMVERHKGVLNQHGTGIGLSISSKIVSSLGG